MGAIAVNSKIGILVLTLLTIISRPAVMADQGQLSGKMDWWQRVVGTWSCELTIEPTQGQVKQTWLTIAKGSVAPGNVFRWSEIMPGIEADQYDGYSLTNRAWWETQADSSGYATLFRSLNGTIYYQVSTRTSLEGDRSVYRERYGFHRDGTFHVDVQRKSRRSWAYYSSSSCSRERSVNPAA